MKTIQVTRVVDGGPVDGAIHLQVEQEGTNELALLILPADALDDFIKAARGAPSKPEPAEPAEPEKGPGKKK